jgi:hypothetical protein
MSSTGSCITAPMEDGGVQDPASFLPRECAGPMGPTGFGNVAGRAALTFAPAGPVGSGAPKALNTSTAPSGWTGPYSYSLLACQRSSSAAVAGISASRSDSSWIVAPTSRSPTSLSCQWCAQNKSSEPETIVART